MSKETECNKCKIESISSKGFGNTYSEPDIVGKRTIYQGKGSLINCRKCPKCGRSWTLGKNKEENNKIRNASIKGGERLIIEAMEKFCDEFPQVENAFWAQSVLNHLNTLNGLEIREIKTKE